MPCVVGYHGRRQLNDAMKQDNRQEYVSESRIVIVRTPANPCVKQSCRPGCIRYSSTAVSSFMLIGRYRAEIFVGIVK